MLPCCTFLGSYADQEHNAISLVHVICFVLRFLRLNMFKDYFYPPQNRCIQGIFIYTFKASTALSLSYGQKMNNGNFELVIFLHWCGALYQLFAQILIIITCNLFLQASRFLFFNKEYLAALHYLNVS